MEPTALGSRTTVVSAVAVSVMAAGVTTGVGVMVAVSAATDFVTEAWAKVDGATATSAVDWSVTIPAAAATGMMLVSAVVGFVVPAGEAVTDGVVVVPVAVTGFVTVSRAALTEGVTVTFPAVAEDAFEAAASVAGLIAELAVAVSVMGSGMTDGMGLAVVSAVVDFDAVPVAAGAGAMIVSAEV